MIIGYVMEGGGTSVMVAKLNGANFEQKALREPECGGKNCAEFQSSKKNTK